MTNAEKFAVMAKLDRMRIELRSRNPENIETFRMDVNKDWEIVVRRKDGISKRITE